MAKFTSATAREAGLKGGRPRNSDSSPTGGSDGQAFVDPSAAGQAAGEPDEPGPRLKRPPEPKSAAAGAGGPARPGKAQSASLDLSSAIGVIQGAHLIMAQLRSEPHWLINDDDAKRYGQAMANAARH